MPLFAKSSGRDHMLQVYAASALARRMPVAPVLFHQFYNGQSASAPSGGGASPSVKDETEEDMFLRFDATSAALEAARLAFGSSGEAPAAVGPSGGDHSAILEMDFWAREINRHAAARHP